MSAQKPKKVGRYGEYSIVEGVVNGMYYVYERDIFVGMEGNFDNAIDLIRLREGMMFEEDKVEDLR